MSKPPLPTLSAAAATRPPAVVPRLRDMMSALRQLHNRERARVRAEIAHLPGFLGLLLKPSTGRAWSRAERRALRMRWRRMGRLGLYLTSMVVPGTTLTLPLLAWWLDRRERRAGKAAALNNVNPAG